MKPIAKKYKIKNKNQGNVSEGQLSLDWLEVLIALEQSWMGRPEETRQPEEYILFFDSQVLC